MANQMDGASCNIVVILPTEFYVEEVKSFVANDITLGTIKGSKGSSGMPMCVFSTGEIEVLTEEAFIKRLLPKPTFRNDYIKPLYLNPSLDEVELNRLLVDNGAIINVLPL